MSGVCSHKYVQGINKGKLCSIPCRGEFCFKHKPKTIERKKSYYREQNKTTINHEYDNLKEMIKNGTVPNVIKYELECSNLYNELVVLSKKILGIKLFLGKITTEEIEKKYDKIFNSSLYKEADEMYCQKNCQGWSSKLINDSKKGYIARHANFKKALFTPYNGTKSVAKQLLVKACVEKDALMEKRKNLQKLVRLIEDIQNEEVEEVIEIIDV